ncbi:MAG: dimethyl sulfoxide reductase anchor subunit [Rubrivivax sp.]|nr:dimethyl sulfoxide reductase anchor subunit [Rubrivivax sp.]
MTFGPRPWLQAHWDGRAAANFIAGGAGSGLVVFTTLAGGPAWAHALGAALVALGLAAVALEIGRPWRSLNVFLNPRRSWMSREAWAALGLVGGAALATSGSRAAGIAAALFALAFVYCQGRILRAAKGIPAWREPHVAALVLATALAEGGALHLIVTTFAAGSNAMQAGTPGGPPPWPPAAWTLFGLALLARLALWTAWRRGVHEGPLAPAAQARVDADGRFFKAASWLPLALALAIVLSPLPSAAQWTLAVLAGTLAVAGGAWFKFSLVRRVAFNQGFAIGHLPVRGATPPRRA